MSRKIAMTFGILIVLAMLAGVFAPALAATEYDVVVNNKNPYTIELTFVGLKVYQFDLAPGKTTIQLERGSYRHSYYGCGQLNFGDFTVKLRDNDLVIANCNQSSGTSSKPADDEGVFTIINRSTKPLSVSLVGQFNFVLDAQLGKTEHVVKRGTYQLSYYDCGKLNIETVKITKETEYRIDNCTAPKEPTIDPRARVLFVKNQTYTSFPIYLIGLDTNKDYEFTLAAGSNKLYVLPGTYRYSYYACSALHYGNVKVTLRGADMKIPDCSSSANGDAQTANLGSIKIKNNTNGLLYVQLNGQFNYLFSVLGSSGTFTAEKGYYVYTLYGCGRTFKGEVVIGQNESFLKTPICKNVSQ